MYRCNLGIYENIALQENILFICEKLQKHISIPDVTDDDILLKLKKARTRFGKLVYY